MVRAKRPYSGAAPALQQMAAEYGTRETQALVTDAIREVTPTPLRGAV